MTSRSDTGGVMGRGVPRRAIACGVLVIAAKVTLSLPRLSTQPALVAITWAAVCSFVAVGLVLFRTSVPSANAWGCLLAAAATIPGDLAEGAYEHVGLTPFGYLFEQVYLAATVALALRFPDLRLTSSGRLIVGGLLASAVGLRAVVLATSGPLPSGFHPPPGWRTVPSSALIHDGAMRLSLAATALVLTGGAGVLASRLHTNRGVGRESLVPIAVIGSIAALAAAVEQSVRLSATTSPYSWAPAMVRDLAAVAIPVALLGHLLRRRAAGATIAARVVAAAQTGNPAELQQALRHALSDPTLVVDTHRRPGYAPPRPGRRLREVADDDGTLLCVLDLDERSSDDELLEAAVGAARLGIENARLHDELVTHMEEVRQSRARIVEASAAERRRVERDLHDGVQQQLLAIAALLSRAGLAGDGDSMRPKVDRARRQLQDALAELRRLAHGFHPAALSQGGLPTALPQLALMSPVPVHVHLDDQLRERRLPGSVESTVYFVVAEALANVTKHADAASAGVRVEIVDDEALVLTVQDDGIGGAVACKGGGIEVVAQVGDVPRLMSAVDALAPDAAVVDVRMPPEHTDEGIRAALALRKQYPSVGVLVLSTYIETGWVARLLGAGTDGLGYLLKDRVDDVQTLVDALRRVARGGTALDQEVVVRLVRRGGHGLERLSNRQRDVLTLMAQGLSNSGIARRLSINERTIETHVTAIFTQLDLDHHDDVNRRVLAVLTLLRDTPR